LGEDCPRLNEGKGGGQNIAVLDQGLEKRELEEGKKVLQRAPTFGGEEKPPWRKAKTEEKKKKQ